MEETSSDEEGEEDSAEGEAVPLRPTRGLPSDVANAIRSATSQALCAAEVQAIFESRRSCGLPISTAAPEDLHGLMNPGELHTV